VGREVLAGSAAIGGIQLRLGVRARTGPRGGGEVVAVDVRDPASLRAFLDGADVLVNCLGPGFRTRGQIAAEAAAAGVAYLDPNGDDVVHARIAAATDGSGVPVLTGVGAVPGAFGLLGRWFAGGLPVPVRRLRGYLVTMEPMHPGTAAEFLLGVLSGAPAEGAAVPGLRLPHVNGVLTGHPLATTESAALAADLRVRDAAFYHCFDVDGASLRFLGTLGSRIRGGCGVRELAGELAASVGAELDGREPLQLIAFEAGGRCVALRSPSSYLVTAAVALLAAAEVLDGRVPAGLHRADVLSPDLMTRLTDVDPRIRLDVRDGDLADWIDR
jgi:hypothetical protein